MSELRKLAEDAAKLDHNESYEWYSKDVLMSVAYYPKNAAFMSAAKPAEVIGLLDEIERLKDDIVAEKMYSKQAGEAVEQIAAERDELSAKIKALESEKESLMEELQISELGNEVKANRLVELAGQDPVAWAMNGHFGGVGVDQLAPNRVHNLYAAAGAVPDYAKAIHYPECWDTMAYPSADAALREMVAWFKCSNEDCSQAVPMKERPDFISGYDAGMADAKRMSAGAAPTEPLSQFDIRGQLAARLSCWHRLTESEADELVTLFEVVSAPAAPKEPTL